MQTKFKRTLLEHSLSVKLITYNRAERLESTLKVWNHCALRNISLEILNNASTDTTEDVIERAKLENANIKSIRNPYNIGLAANILRSYERFTTDYCWLLCDDDNLTIDKTIELEEAIFKNVDFLLVGSFGLRKGLAGSIDPKKEFPSGSGFYFYGSFLPNIIFKREFINSNSMRLCYKTSGTLFPHAPLLEEIYSKSNSAHILEELLVSRRSNPDIVGVGINWMYEVATSGRYLQRNKFEWSRDFLKAFGYEPIQIFFIMCLRWRLWGQLSLDKALIQIDAINGGCIRSLSLLMASVTPVFVLRMLKFLFRSRDPHSSRESTDRFN